MLKQIVAIVLLSILILLTMLYMQTALQGIVSAHDWIAERLTEVFSGGRTGNMIRELLALLIIPVVVGLIPALIYWAVKRDWFPYFMQTVWVIWLAQTVALIVQYKVAAV